MELILFIGLLVVWYYLSSRISTLEERMNTLEADRSVNQAPRPIPVPDTAFATRVQTMSSAEAMAEVERRQNADMPRTNGLFEWMAQDFMMKLGSLLLLLAVGWFVSYAVMEEWIGPVGQITLGLFFGLLLLLLGTWRIKEYRHQGGIFTVLGATVVLLTLFAARGIYDFFTPISALVIMFSTVAFVALVSVKYRSERLAFSGLVLANIAPFLTAAMPMQTVELFLYLLVITVGMLSTVWVTGWTKLIPLSLLFTYFYSLAYLIDSAAAQQDTTLLFSFLFVGIYFASNVVSLVRRRSEVNLHMSAHLLTALGTVVFLFTWVESSVAPEWKSLLYTAWAVVFALATYVMYFYTANRNAFYLYGAAAVALLGIATAAELEGPSLVMMYVLEIGLLIIAARKIGMATFTMSRMSWLFVIPVLLSLESFAAREWRQGIPGEHFTVLVVVMSMLALIGWYLHERSKEAEQHFSVSLTIGVLFTVSSLYAAALLWLILHAVLAADTATMFALIIYTVAGITLLVHEASREREALRFAGWALIAFVMMRLLFIEVWNMSLEGRIATFLVIGILLISTAFLRKRLHALPDEN